MHFVNVLRDVSLYKKIPDITLSILKNCKNALVPLFKSKDEIANKPTVEDFTKQLVAFKNKYSVQGVKIWVDSGGYAVFKSESELSRSKMRSIKNNTTTGKTKQASKNKPAKIDLKLCSLMVNQYINFISNIPNELDYFFSLDLPLSKSSTVSSRSIIKINEKSLSLTRAVLEKKHYLQDKFYYVIHFLHDDQYKIWNDIYKRLHLDQVVKCRALGGMVSSRKIKHAIPSPFVGMAYKCLIDFLDANKYHSLKEFKLHFLGINLIQDRFQIILLEKIFERYLEQYNISVVFTYDSSYYNLNALKNHLGLPLYVYGKDLAPYFATKLDDVNVNSGLAIAKKDKPLQLRYLNAAFDASCLRTVRRILTKSEEKRNFKLKKDIENRIQKENGKKDDRTNDGLLEYFQPLNLLSNISIDNIMLDSINDLKIIDSFFNHKKIKRVANETIFSISHCREKESDYSGNMLSLLQATLFDNIHLLWSIRRNMILTFEYHQWFMNNRDNTTMLDSMIEKFVHDFHDKDKKW